MKQYSHSLRGIIAGAATGLAALISGCPPVMPESPPVDFSLTESDGTRINSVDGHYRGPNGTNEFDEVYVVPMDRGKTRDIVATFSGGSPPLAANFYEHVGDQPNAWDAEIVGGNTTQDSISTKFRLAAMAKANLGEYLAFEGRAVDANSPDWQTGYGAGIIWSNASPMPLLPIAAGANEIYWTTTTDPFDKRIAVFVDVRDGSGGNQPSYTPGDGVCETDKGENHSNSPADCPITPPYTPGDGVCESDKGENHHNSPQDCPPYTPDDGTCDSEHGENHDNSPNDCPPHHQPTPLEDLLNQTHAEIVDGFGNPVSPISYDNSGAEVLVCDDQGHPLPGPVAHAELWGILHGPTELFERVGGPTNFLAEELGYTGEGDCFNITWYGAPQKIDESNGFTTYEAQFGLEREIGCANQEEELIQIKYDLHTAPGQITYFTDSETATLNPPTTSQPGN